jgi:hypothetical protein
MTRISQALNPTPDIKTEYPNPRLNTEDLRPKTKTRTPTCLSECTIFASTQVK